MSSNNNSPGDDFEPIVLSDRRSINSDEDDYESNLEKSPKSDGNYIQEQDRKQQYLQQNYNVVANSQNNEYQNESLQVAQIYQNFRGNQIEDIKQLHGLDQIKYRYSSQFLNQDSKQLFFYFIFFIQNLTNITDNTPKSPSYLKFAPESIKIQQDPGHNEGLMNNLDDFSPIYRMEDSRADMTVQMFDLSMMQSRELINNGNIHSNKNQRGPGKSSFSNQFIQINKDQNMSKQNNNSQSPHKKPPNVPQPSISIIPAQKNEIKNQKLKERFEKYSNQMMNNINLQKGQNDISQKNQTKNVQRTGQKTQNTSLVENKRVQSIKTSAKSSKVSTPITSKNTLGDVKIDDSSNNEQKRVKSQNSYTKPTQSSQRRIDQQKPEKNTQIYQQNGILIPNTDFAKLQQQIKSNQQKQILHQKDQQKHLQNQSQSNNNKQLTVQTKFLLPSPQKSQTIPNQNSPTKPSQFSRNSSNSQSQNRQKKSDTIGSYDQKSNQQKQQKPPSNINLIQNNYMSAGSYIRKNSESTYDRSSKIGNSSENLKFNHLDQYNNQCSLEKRQTSRTLFQNYESLPEQNNNQNRDEENYISLLNVKQQYIESQNSNQEQMQKNNLQQDMCNKQNDQDESDLTNIDDDSYAINIYKTQFTQNSKNKLDNQEDDGETCDIPQIYTINRSQSQRTHHDKDDQEKDIQEKNSNQNFMKKSFTQDNMLQNKKYLQDLNSQRVTNQRNDEDNNTQYVNNQGQDIDNSFNEGGKNYYSNYNQFNRNLNSKVSTTNINTKETHLQTDNSNYTAYTNGISYGNQASTLQSYKAVSSAKFIDQDEDEIQNQQDQFINILHFKNKEEQNSQNQFGEMKVYDFSQKQSDKDIIQGQKGQNNSQKQSRKSSNAQKSENKNQIKITNLNFNNIQSLKDVQSKRLSDQMDVRRKTESSSNKGSGNNNNQILNTNHPICLYNLHKNHQSRNNSKNNQNNSINNQQNSNNFNNSKYSNQNSYQKIKQSPSFHESPMKVSEVSYNFGNSGQKQKESSNNLNQQQDNKNFFSLQQQKSNPQFPIDSQQYGSIPTNSANIITTQSSNQGSPIIMLPQNQYNTTPSTPQKAINKTNNQNIFQHNQQNMQYQQQFQQKQAGRIVSQRELKSQNDKYVHKSIDSKYQQGQEMNDKAIQRKGSSGIFRGSCKDGEDSQQRNLALAKSFQGDSNTKRDSNNGNSSFHDNQQNQQNEQKTMFNYVTAGNDRPVQNNKKQNQQSAQTKTERIAEQQGSYMNPSISQQSNININQNGYKNSRKNSSKSNMDAQKQYEYESQVESQRQSLKSSKQQQNYQSNNFVQDIILIDDQTSYQQQQQQKQAIQIQKMLGKCFNKQNTDGDYNSKGKNTSNKVSNNQKGSQKSTLTTSYDTNIDYILKHLKEQQKLTSQEIAKNQNSSFNLNNRSLTNSTHQKPQSKPQSNKANQIPAAPAKESFSKYHQLIQEKSMKHSALTKSPPLQNVVTKNIDNDINMRIQKAELEVQKIQQQKQQFALENDILEQQNKILKQQLVTDYQNQSEYI